MDIAATSCETANRAAVAAPMLAARRRNSAILSGAITFGAYP